MGAQDGAHECHGRQSEQHAVRAKGQGCGAVRVAHGAVPEPGVQEQGLGNEQDHREEGPDGHHGVHPPVAGLGEPLPDIQSPRHPQAREPSQGHGPADLGAERALDRLEQVEGSHGRIDP